MKHTAFRIILLFLLTAGTMLLSVSCARPEDTSDLAESSNELSASESVSPEYPTDGESSSTDEVTDDESADNTTASSFNENERVTLANMFSNDALNSYVDLQLSNSVFSAVYLGNKSEGDTTELREWIQNNMPALYATVPLLGEIPDEYVIGDHGDLFFIVPNMNAVSVTVNKLEWTLLGNGADVEKTDRLYESEYPIPLLVFCEHAGITDDTSLSISCTLRDGRSLDWFPTYDPDEPGKIISPIDDDLVPMIYDFSYYGELGEYIPIDIGTPTLLGASSRWETENGWLLHLGYIEESDDDVPNGMVLYHPCVLEDGTTGLERDCHGTWYIEEDTLVLDAYAPDGTAVGGSFPTLVTPAGNLYIFAARDGSTPPFFDETTTVARLTPYEEYTEY